MVGGAVKQPGIIPLRGPRGVVEAVIGAGGFEHDARMNEVVLIRRGPGNRPMLRTVDVRSFIQSASFEISSLGSTSTIPLSFASVSSTTNEIKLPKKLGSGKIIQIEYNDLPLYDLDTIGQSFRAQRPKQTRGVHGLSSSSTESRSKLRKQLMLSVKTRSKLVSGNSSSTLLQFCASTSCRRGSSSSLSIGACAPLEFRLLLHFADKSPVVGDHLVVNLSSRHDLWQWQSLKEK